VSATKQNVASVKIIIDLRMLPFGGHTQEKVQFAGYVIFFEPHVCEVSATILLLLFR
jgi:hypothetical protein